MYRGGDQRLSPPCRQGSPLFSEDGFFFARINFFRERRDDARAPRSNLNHAPRVGGAHPLQCTALEAPRCGCRAGSARRAVAPAEVRGVAGCGCAWAPAQEHAVAPVSRFLRHMFAVGTRHRCAIPCLPCNAPAGSPCSPQPSPRLKKARPACARCSTVAPPRTQPRLRLLTTSVCARGRRCAQGRRPPLPANAVVLNPQMWAMSHTATQRCPLPPAGSARGARGRTAGFRTPARRARGLRWARSPRRAGTASSAGRARASLRTRARARSAITMAGRQKCDHVLTKPAVRPRCLAV